MHGIDNHYALSVKSSTADYKLICSMYRYLIDHDYLYYNGRGLDWSHIMDDEFGLQSFRINIDSLASLSSVCHDIAPIILALQKEGLDSASLIFTGDVQEETRADRADYTAFRICWLDGLALLFRASCRLPLSSDCDDGGDLFFNPEQEALQEIIRRLNEAQTEDFIALCKSEAMPDATILADLCRMVRAHITAFGNMRSGEE